MQRLPTVLSLLPLKSTNRCDNFPLLSGPSGQPQQVTLTAVTSTSIKVSWGPLPADDRNGIIKGYKVNYQSLPNGDIELEFVNITSQNQDEGEEKILQNLNEFTNYSISVLAFTEIGDGPPSVAKVKQTLQDGKLN